MNSIPIQDKIITTFKTVFNFLKTSTMKKYDIVEIGRLDGPNFCSPASWKLGQHQGWLVDNNNNFE